MRIKAAYSFGIALVCAALLAGCLPGGRVPVRPEQIEVKPLDFKPPKAEKFEGPGGMTVYLMTDRELPLVAMTAWFRVGRIYDPADKVGLARLTGEVMRTGGAKGLGYEQMDEELEFLAAGVESGIGEEFGKVSMDCLKKDLGRVFEIFSLVAREPAFAPEKVDLAKNQLIESLRRRNDDPEEILRREFRYLIFGKNSPWARQPKIAEVAKLTRDDLAAFHHDYVAPDRMILAVSGDITRAETESLLKERFGDWAAKGKPLPEAAPIDPNPPASVNLIEIDKTQSQIRIGHPGPRRGGPDEAAFEVLNEIFGTGMTSRMFQDIRSTRGLAYSVYGFLVPGKDRGFFITSAGTKSQSTVECAQAMLGQIHGLSTNPPTPTELMEAQSALVKKMVFQYDSAEKIVNRRAELELLGYPPDYLETYAQRVRAVTLADLKRVIATDIHTGGLITLVVGHSEAFDHPLGQLGAVKKIELEKD